MDQRKFEATGYEIRREGEIMNDIFSREIQSLQTQLDLELENRRKMESRSLLQYQQMLDDGNVRMRVMEDCMQDVILEKRRAARKAELEREIQDEKTAGAADAARAIAQEMKALGRQLVERRSEKKSHSSPLTKERAQTLQHWNRVKIATHSPEMDSILKTCHQITDVLRDGPPNITPSKQCLVEWLHENSVEKYVPHFLSHNHDITSIKDLTESDLEEMGIDALGARRRIMVALRTLNPKLEVVAVVPEEYPMLQHIALLQTFYTKYDPAKVPDAERIAREYATRMPSMYMTLCNVYNIPTLPHRDFVLTVLHKICPPLAPAVNIMLVLQQGREAELLMDVLTNNISGVRFNRENLWVIRKDGDFFNRALQIGQRCRPMGFLEQVSLVPSSPPYQTSRPHNPTIGDTLQAARLRRSECRYQLMALFLRNDPRRMPEVDVMIDHFEGHELQLVEHMTRNPNKVIGEEDTD